MTKKKQNRRPREKLTLPTEYFSSKDGIEVSCSVRIDLSTLRMPPPQMNALFDGIAKVLIAKNNLVNR